MITNAQIGIEKEVKDLQAEMALKRVDFDFFSTGIPITDIKEHSANHLFGSGSWKKAVREKLGAETLEKRAEKYGNKPIDFKLAAFHFEPEHARFFIEHENVSVNSATGKYNGEYKVAARGKDHIVVMAPFMGSDSGKLVNVSKLNGAKRKMEYCQGRLSQLTGTSNPQTTSAPSTEPAPPPPREPNPDIDLNDNNNNTMKTVLTILALAGLAYGGYKAYQYFSKSK